MEKTPPCGAHVAKLFCRKDQIFAVSVVKSWSLIRIANKVTYSMVGGEPTDNSIELGEYY
jgi:hypothetical protein